MTAPRRTEREISRALRLGRAARGVDELRRAALAGEQEFAAELAATAPSMRESAYNLVHYLAVRRHDARELQDELTRLGLSSPYIRETLRFLIDVLKRMEEHQHKKSSRLRKLRVSEDSRSQSRRPVAPPRVAR